MDNPTPAAQPTTPPMNPAPPTNTPTKSGKNNLMTLVIAFIIILAVLITGGAYFFVSQKRSNTPTAVAPTPTPIPTIQKALWEKYTDEKHGYSFNYPGTWVLTPASDPSQFELTFNKAEVSAKVKGGFLTKAETNKITAKECVANTDPTKSCNTYGLTAASKLYLHVTMTNNLPSSEDIFITRPNDEGIYFNITKTDPESHQIVQIILNTIRFTNEPRLVKLRICPDSVSADNKTITYFGATFTPDEVDQEYIKTECKK